jgi:hypothetical protein
MAEQHPARAAAERSMEYVHAKKREDWIANFAAAAPRSGHSGTA